MCKCSHKLAYVLKYPSILSKSSFETYQLFHKSHPFLFYTILLYKVIFLATYVATSNLCKCTSITIISNLFNFQIKVILLHWSIQMYFSIYITIVSNSLSMKHQINMQEKMTTYRVQLLLLSNIWLWAL